MRNLNTERACDLFTIKWLKTDPVGTVFLIKHKSPWKCFLLDLGTNYSPRPPPQLYHSYALVEMSFSLWFTPTRAPRAPDHCSLPFPSLGLFLGGGSNCIALPTSGSSFTL